MPQILINQFCQKFDTYRFADYKGHFIDLLKRVYTISMESTMIVRQMK